MAWVFTKARRITKRRHDEDAQAILDRLAAYLEDENSDFTEMLCGFWRDQQDAITYQEMRELVLAGYVNEVTARLWQQDYSELVKNRMPQIWNGAMIQGAANTPLLSSLPSFTFNTQTPGVIRWIQSRGAEMVTVSTQRQKDAIALLLEDKMRNAHTVDELARLIRPCVGLYRQQAAAVTNYYEHMVKTLTEQHPRTRPERIQLKALEQSTKYAERLHRQRALMIAQTEMAFAYNYGADEGVRQAQENFLVGRCEKVWCTSGDAQVCDKCAALDGKRIGMEERFYDGNTRYEESGLYPPLHPRCACAVQYVEIEPPPVQRLESEHVREERTADEQREQDREERASDVFTVFPPAKGDAIKPQSLYKELQKSDAGKHAYQLILDKRIPVSITYIPAETPKGTYGMTFDGYVQVFALNTKTIKQTARTIIHEIKHIEMDTERPSQWEECHCFIEAEKHNNKDLTLSDMRRIIRDVKRLYPELPWR